MKGILGYTKTIAGHIRGQEDYDDDNGNEEKWMIIISTYLARIGNVKGKSLLKSNHPGFYISIPIF